MKKQTRSSEADLIYQKGWNDCLECVIKDMEKDIEETKEMKFKIKEKTNKGEKA